MAYQQKTPNRDGRSSPWRRLSGRGMQRIVVLGGIFGVLTFVVLFAKLWQLQVVEHETLENKAISQQTREITSTANRGTIYDANGDVLAISGSVQNVILSPRDVLKAVEVDEKDEFGNARSQTAIDAEKETKTQQLYDLIADNMSRILGIDREESSPAWERPSRPTRSWRRRWRMILPTRCAASSMSMTWKAVCI